MSCCEIVNSGGDDDDDDDNGTGGYCVADEVDGPNDGGGVVIWGW